MASINFGWIGDNWFKKPPNPIPLINFNETLSQKVHRKPDFASIGTSIFKRWTKTGDSSKPGRYRQMLDQYFWECENLPDFRNTPEVERILSENPFIEKKENPTEEEIEENKQFWKEFNNSPVAKFLKRAEFIAQTMNELELKENSVPYKREDRKLWEEVPNVPGPDGRPMPRKAIKTRRESDDKFWDFARQFFFGLWGFRQRPYPPGRPIDVAQAIGYNRLERRYYDRKIQ